MCAKVARVLGAVGAVCDLSGSEVVFGCGVSEFRVETVDGSGEAVAEVVGSLVVGTFEEVLLELSGDRGGSDFGASGGGSGL
jgi:hypothetical protein